MFDLKEGKEYFGEDFVKQFKSILRNCENNNNFLFIHGESTKQNAEDICNYGLTSDLPELYYTAEFISSKDNLLYDKLKSWPHWNYRFLVMCVVPKSSGKGGTPIWKDGEYESVVLLPEFIKGYIDVTQKSIVQNELYLPTHNHQGMIEDRSYLPMTGQMIEISMPPDEEEFYDELLNPEK